MNRLRYARQDSRPPLQRQQRESHPRFLPLEEPEIYSPYSISYFGGKLRCSEKSATRMLFCLLKRREHDE